MGVLLSLFFCLICTTALLPLVQRLWPESDPAERIGVSGLIGLGFAGTLVTFLGIIPDFLKSAVFILAGATVILAAFSIRKKSHLIFRFTLPSGLELISFAVLSLFILFALIASLTPSTVIDWDSLAYHLAVPKLWLSAGEVQFIPTIHHSNFPFALDGLYIYGLTWGGESSAKIFTWATFALGTVALYGLGRRWTTSKTAWIAPLLFCSAPVVLWESGTAYIDVGHGLYAGLAVLYLAEFVTRKKQNLDSHGLPILVGILLGLALGTKFTGIQVAAGALLVYLIAARQDVRSMLKPAGIIAGFALLVGGPWFLKTAAYTGNPVFPFFHEQFDSPFWDQKRADIYRNEQRTFGVGHTASGRDWSQLGHAVLGLGYQSGRFVNPAQQIGGGFPTGAIGFATMLAFLLLAASGRARGKSAIVLGWIGISLLLWFVLSQQSRYLTMLVVPASLLATTIVRKTKFGYLFITAVACQAAYTLWLIGTSQTQNQLRVLTGQISVSDYRKATTPFALMAEAINADEDIKKIALYDEVFGFLLDKNYVWANPGHGVTLEYEKVEDAHAFVALLKSQDFDSIYYGFVGGPADRDKWLATSGLGSGDTYSSEELHGMQSNWEVKWKALLALSVQEGLVEVVRIESRGILLRIP